MLQNSLSSAEAPPPPTPGSRYLSLHPRTVLPPWLGPASAESAAWRASGTSWTSRTWPCRSPSTIIPTSKKGRKRAVGAALSSPGSRQETPPAADPRPLRGQPLPCRRPRPPPRCGTAWWLSRGRRKKAGAGTGRSPSPQRLSTSRISERGRCRRGTPCPASESAGELSPRGHLQPRAPQPPLPTLTSWQGLECTCCRRLGRRGATRMLAPDRCGLSPRLQVSPGLLTGNSLNFCL